MIASEQFGTEQVIDQHATCTITSTSTRSDTPGTSISDVRICDDQRYGTSTTSSTTATTRMKATVPRASEDCDAVRTLFHLASLDSTKVQIVDV
jgi:hypothetical protein